LDTGNPAAPEPLRLCTVQVLAGDAASLARCRDWYLKLGLATSTDTPGESVYFLTGRDTLFGLHVGEPVAPAGSITVTLEVDDVDAIYARLASGAIQFVSEPRDRVWGGRTVELRDPIGTQVELLTWSHSGRASHKLES